MLWSHAIALLHVFRQQLHSLERSLAPMLSKDTAYCIACSCSRHGIVGSEKRHNRTKQVCSIVKVRQSAEQAAHAANSGTPVNTLVSNLLANSVEQQLQKSLVA
jgi:hypothetical protein